MSDLFIGTSGYDYPEWKGVFYPKDLKRKDFLSYYATQFNALELNNTFYNMSTSERLLSFYERSEGKQSFSVKATYTERESQNGSVRYCYDYSDEELAQFVPIIKAAEREGKKVQVYFNNHPNGSEAKNAISLKKMIEKDETGEK